MTVIIYELSPTVMLDQVQKLGFVVKAHELNTCVTHKCGFSKDLTLSKAIFTNDLLRQKHWVPLVRCQGF